MSDKLVLNFEFLDAKLSIPYIHDIQVINTSVSGNPKFELRFQLRVALYEVIGYLQYMTYSSLDVTGTLT